MARRELGRRHLLDFVRYVNPGYQASWHHREIADALEEVERGENARLMIFVPPRHGKSELASKHFPAWALGRHPDWHVALGSYGADLAQDFGRSTRNVMRTSEYANLFHVGLAEDSQAAGRWHTDKGGGYAAVGIGGALTGRGANVLIIDDPTKDRQEADSPTYQDRAIEWYRSTAYTRLAPGGAVIVIATRWGERDLPGFLLSEEAKGGDKWRVISLPAIATQDEPNRKAGEALWPERFPKDALDRIRQNVGTREWLALYQQSPVDNVSSEFRTDWFRQCTEAEATHAQVARYLAIDTAISEHDGDDYTGWADCSVGRDGTWHLRAKRLRVNPAELINLLFLTYEAGHHMAIGIEEGIYSKAIAPFLAEEQRKRNVHLPIRPLKHGGRAKVLRIRGLIPRYERGGIRHVSGECTDLEAELLRFPASAHDDVSDAVAYLDQVIVPPAHQDQADREMLRLINANRQSPPPRR